MAVTSKTCRQNLHPATATRLLGLTTMMVYLSAYAAWPYAIAVVCGASPNAAASIGCSCPMCATDDKGVHHCSCCTGKKRCECGISSGSDNHGVAVSLEVGIPVMPRSFLPPPASGCSFTAPVSAPEDLDLNVPTPPPRA